MLYGRPFSASTLSQRSGNSFGAGNSDPAESELGAEVTDPSGACATRNASSSGFSFDGVNGVGALSAVVMKTMFPLSKGRGRQTGFRTLTTCAKFSPVGLMVAPNQRSVGGRETVRIVARQPGAVGGNHLVLFAPNTEDE